MHAAARATGAYKYTLAALAVLCLVSGTVMMLARHGADQRRAGGVVVAHTPAMTPTPTPTPKPPDDPLAPPALAGTWRPIFVESFNGQTLDASRWNTCFWWDNTGLGCDGSVANGELQRYLPGNVSVHNGTLDIVARHEIYSTDSRTYEYTSGVVTTEGKFAFRYGYVEARMQMGAGRGIWPAFWLLPQDHSSTNEVDVAEILCDRPAVVNTALHFVAGGRHASVGGVYQGPSFAQGFHVVAVDWEPHSVTWYVDGKVIYRVTSVAQIPQTDMYVLLNTAVGGYWSGNPDHTTPFPHHFLADWVQVWQHA